MFRDSVVRIRSHWQSVIMLTNRRQNCNNDEKTNMITLFNVDCKGFFVIFYFNAI